MTEVELASLLEVVVENVIALRNWAVDLLNWLVENQAWIVFAAGLCSYIWICHVITAMICSVSANEDEITDPVLVELPKAFQDVCKK